MARYGLIIRDKTYIAILQKAAEEQKSFGKYVNEILDAFVSNETKKTPRAADKVCEICGATPFYETFMQNGKKGLRCRYHKPESYFPGYREVGESINASVPEVRDQNKKV